MRTSLMVAAAWCALMAVILAPGAAALDCGAAGDVAYLSGCLNCTSFTFNHTQWQKNKTKEGKGKAWGSKDGKPGHAWPAGPITMPSCTQCDTANHFVLVTKDNDHAKRNSSKPTIGRCGCADGYGVNITGNATVQWGNKTKAIPTFTCKPCDAATEVALTKASGLKPQLDPVTGQWSLVLKGKKAGLKQKAAGSQDGSDDISAANGSEKGPGGPVAAASSDKKGPKDGKSKDGKSKDGKKKGDGNKQGKKWGKDGGWGVWKASPFVPGSCVRCPEGSKKDGLACGHHRS